MIEQTNFILTFFRFFVAFFQLGLEKHEVGRVRDMTVNPCKAQKETFTKFTSNALGDPYQDPGKFNGQLRSSSTSTKAKPFLSMHGNRTVR